MDFPFAEHRADFPITGTQVQLTSCSQSAMSVKVKEAVQRYMDSWEHHGMDWPGWMAELEAAKSSFARMIGAKPENIAAVSSVSHAASAVASAIDFRGNRNEILVSEMDFPTIGHVWLSQTRRGAQVRFIEWDGAPLTADKIAAKLTPQTRVVSLAHQSYYNGARSELAEVAEVVRRNGALLFVDAYQSLGNMAFNANDIGLDCVATGLQKYLLGAPGIAFLYVSGEVANALTPTVTGWFGQQDPFAFELQHLDPAVGARRFEAGTPPVVNSFIARAALDYLLATGMDRIENYLDELFRWAWEEASSRNLPIASPSSGPVGPNLAIRVPDAPGYEQALREQGILVSARSDVIRIAPHFYNAPSDITTALEAIAKMMGRG